ncbi:MAG TPA: tRNA epoxyqueuosine(34) reductase QueG [Solibacterales bacterium]|nr:tRNA epoxyqueuosine(34) reductase QueG [Bryobacterales bacterium]
MSLAELRNIAAACGFELCGVTPARPAADAVWFERWAEAGYAGRMGYLTDYRKERRRDPRSLLPAAETVVCVGKLYNGPQAGHPQISRYAWGRDYHDVLRAGLEQLARALGEHEYKICVDTAPLLERSYAQLAGLGWIGKNTCLINQQAGSWFFLGEMLTSLRITGEPQLAADRCGTCTRCIDACPTQAILPLDGRRHSIDARLCIAYLTIELRGAVPEELRPAMGNRIFGCDICQDVCPWNARAPVTDEFAPLHPAQSLEQLAALTAEQFQAMYRDTPVPHARYTGFLRNVAIAMGNAAETRFRPALEELSRHSHPSVAESARWALGLLPSV